MFSLYLFLCCVLTQLEKSPGMYGYEAILKVLCYVGIVYVQNNCMVVSSINLHLIYRIILLSKESKVRISMSEERIIR